MAREYRNVFNVETVLVNYKSEKYGWRRIPFLGQFSLSDFWSLISSLLLFLVVSFTPILGIPAWLVSGLLHLFGFPFSFPAWLLAVLLAVGFMFLSRKVEPQGKPIWKYLWDGSLFYGRSKVSNGWKPIRTTVAKGKKKHHYRDHLALSLVKNVPFPAYWRGEFLFESKVPFRWREKNGIFFLNLASQGSGKTDLPGMYQNHKGVLKRVSK